MKNKLPRKRKKAFKKAKGGANYMTFQVINEVAFEENGFSDFRFPKYKFIEGQGNIMMGYW
jgi:hypothetical protein